MIITVHTINMGFEWDDDKARKNIHKHGIRFEKALEVFYDPWALYLPDSTHSDTENREYVIGICDKGTLTVSFTERHENVFRIISARPATRAERIMYAERRGN